MSARRNSNKAREPVPSMNRELDPLMSSAVDQAGVLVTGRQTSCQDCLVEELRVEPT